MSPRSRRELEDEEFAERHEPPGKDGPMETHACPNCEAVMTEGEKCPECQHDDGTDFCDCPACGEERDEEGEKDSEPEGDDDD